MYQAQDSLDRAVETKSSREEERSRLSDMRETIAHFESQIAEISQWYLAADAINYCYCNYIFS